MDIESVLSKMTVEEKISLLSGKDFWRTRDIARLGIPSIMVSDGPNGLRRQKDSAEGGDVNDCITAVCFPTASSLAASFDTELLGRVGRLLGEECVKEKTAVLLGPAVNIKRSPLCGRNFEYFSEDPYLAGEAAAAYIGGVQSQGAGTCVKHFCANSCETRRMTSSSEIDERALHEIYLPAFMAAVQKGKADSVMCSYNKLDGVYMCENKRLLTDILRGEWGFEGAVVSDWGAVNDRAKGVLAGLDLEMPGSCGYSAKKLREAYFNSVITDDDLDRCVRRVLRLVDKLYSDRPKEEFDREKHHSEAVDAATKTMVLLKNEGALPLNTAEKIVFIGEFAKKPRYQGGGSSHVKAYKVTNAFDECSKYTEISYVRGFPADRDDYDAAQADEAVAAAKDADVAVIFAGLPDSFESESFDRRHMKLPACQDRLIKRVAAVQKNTVVVLANGSPVEMPWVSSVNAVFEAYLGGEGSGEAEARLLFGTDDPSGRLAETFPVSLADTPAYRSYPCEYNTAEYRESIFVGYRYYYSKNVKVLFPFGHGLSYTTFAYSGLKLSDDKLRGENRLKISFTVKNTGDRAGTETPQLYISCAASTVFRAKKELKGFCKVSLEPGQKQKCEFTVCAQDLAWYNTKLQKFVTDDGEYSVQIGSSSRDIRLTGGFTAEGFGRSPSPYSFSVNQMYANSCGKDLTRDCFEALLGREITVSKPCPPFTLENSLADAKDTPQGKFIIKAMMSVASKKDNGMGNTEMAMASALESPVRSMILMSQGMIGEKEGKDIVSVMNGSKILSNVVRLAVGILYNHNGNK